MTLATYTPHSLFSDTLIFHEKFTPATGICWLCRWTVKYSSAYICNVMGFSIRNFPQCPINNKIQRLLL